MKSIEAAIPNAGRLDRLTLLACALFGLMVLFVIFSGRCLFADGSFYLWKILEGGTFHAFSYHRCVAQFLFELPVVVALKLGIVDLHWLILAFGVGCACAWPIAMWMCYRLAPQHFWLVMFACAMGYLNACFMAVGEHIVAHAFFWPAVFSLLFVRPLTPMAAVSLLLSAGILLRSYESLVFLGPPLAGLAIWRLWQGYERPAFKAILGLAAVSFLYASVVAFDGVVHPDCPSNYGGFKNGIFLTLEYPGWPLKMIYFCGVLVLAAHFPKVRQLLNRPVGWGLIALIILLWGAWPLLVPEQMAPADQYDARFLNFVVPLLLLPLAISLLIRPGWLGQHTQILVKFSAVMLVAQSLWHISATSQWCGYVSEWRTLLTTQRGPVFLDGVWGNKNSANGQALRFDWNWANPGMSLMLGPSQVQALIMPEISAGWQPFDPLNPKALPNLQRYGLHYDRYVKALLKLNTTNQTPPLRQPGEWSL